MVCIEIVVVEPAKISVSNVRAEPTEPTTLDQITVHATLVNSGEVTGSAEVQLTVDGKIVRTDSVTIGAGESKTVTYTLAPLTAGYHRICVDVV